MTAEEKALGRQRCSLAVLEEGLRKKEDRHFGLACCTRARDFGFKLRKVLFRLAIRS